jgi:predicted TIM-barrel fold metal-dependent hydrolase
MAPAAVTFAGFDVFDCHHHVGDVSSHIGEAMGTGVDEPEGVALDDHEIAGRLAIMDAGGVRQAAVIPGHGYLRPHGLSDTARVNDQIAAYRDAHPDRFPVAVGVVEPLYGKAGLAELDRCHGELGLAAISFHTRFQGVSIDNVWVRRYVERMAELGLAVVMHAIPDNTDEALWKVAQLARDLPEVEMLVLDAFSEFESTKQATFVADSCPRLLFDTSLTYTFDFIEVFARRFGAERVVFGTDLYSPPIGRRISRLLGEIVESGVLTNDEKAAIVGGNARRFYGVR